MTACTSYREIEIGQILEQEKVRVTTTDSEHYEVQWPGVYGDTIRGPAPQPRIPLDEVEKLEVQYTDAAETAALVLGILVADAGVVARSCPVAA
jgi:hypothetical protein